MIYMYILIRVYLHILIFRYLYVMQINVYKRWYIREDARKYRLGRKVLSLL